MTAIYCGADRLDTIAARLRGARLAMLTNASGVGRDGIPTYERLAREHHLELLLSPEHGIRTNLQDGGWGGDVRDAETGARVLNVKGEGSELIDEALKDIDIMLYDIQDVGARFYTYLYNLTGLMQRCAAAGVPVIVLDRPNPVSGRIMGPILDEQKHCSSIGQYAIPTRYGLTIGEFARYINSEYALGCRLEVVRCEGWSRELYADETDQLWVNPSPNIPAVSTAINYLGTCIFEATNISEGRGTTRPFDMIGAPFVDSKRLYDELCAQPHEGVIYRRTCFTPQFNKHAGECCEGVELHITDRSVYDPFAAALRILRHMRSYEQYTQRDQGLCLRWGTDWILGAADPEEYLRMAPAALESYRGRVEKYLLY